jgi:hypothetical protein
VQRENPLEEDNKRKADVDHAALVDSELPPLLARAQVGQKTALKRCFSPSSFSRRALRRIRR